MMPPSGNAISQTSHLASKAVDYYSSPDVYIYAPEDATFDSYVQRGSGTEDAGNCLRIRGKTGLHQFAHCEESYMGGGSVVKGQKIAKMGYTGYTIPKGPGGRHLHYWVQTAQGYVYPPNLYTEPFNANIGEDMVTAQTATLGWVLGLDMSTSDPGYQGFERYWVGKPTADMLQWLVDTDRHKDVVTKARNYTDPDAADRTLAEIKKLLKG